MKKLWLSLAMWTVLAWVAAAQSSTQIGDSQNSSASAGPTAAQTQSSTSLSSSQQSAAQQGQNQLQAGSIIYAELSKSVDAKKAKPGDEVQAKASQAVLSQGKVVIPRGAKIIGHVTEAKAREKGQEQSSLGIAFDRAVLKDGTQIPMSRASIQALGSAQSSVAAFAGQEDNSDMTGPASGMPSRSGMGGRSSTGGGVLGGAGSTMGGAANTAGDIANSAGSAAGRTAGTVGATTQAGASTGAHLGAGSHGVVNIPGLSLSAPATNSTQGSVITSDKKNVKLDSGTEMVLRVNQ